MNAPRAPRPARAPYLGLLWTLVRTEFKVRYHGTVGGFVWALLKPAAMFLLLVTVFSFVFGADPDYGLNLIVGLFLWDYFAESTKAGLRALHAHGFLLTRARCPAWILVLTSTSNATITLAVFNAVLFGYLAVANRLPSAPLAVLYIGYCVAFAMIVIGFALAASVLFLRYRDLDQVWDLATQAGFFVAPIIYPLGILPERFHPYLYLWPPTPIVQFSRDVLVRHAVPTATAHLCLAAMAVTCLGAGVAIFRRSAPRAAEYV